MNFMQSVKTCFRKYFVFKGRAARSEFWWFQLFFWLVLVVAGVLLEFLSFDFSDGAFDFILFLEFLLFLPVLSVTSRRLHDIGLVGWLQAPVMLMYLPDLNRFGFGFGANKMIEYISTAGILFFGIILLICIRRSEVGGNKYGPNPKALDMGDVFG